MSQRYKTDNAANADVAADKMNSVSKDGYDWGKFKPSCWCFCFNFVLQLVLVGSLGSFLFGFNLALLNTATKSINSSFLQCGLGFRPGDRFHGQPYSVCSKYPWCLDSCRNSNNVTWCDGALLRQFPFATPEQCANNSLCKRECLKEGKIRCPGGYNDIDCPSLKWYNAFLGCSVLIGAAIGCLTGSGFLAYGRRTVLLVTMYIFIIGIICSTVANSFSALIWGRLIVGYAVGLVSVASPTYMSEVTPKELRGKYGVFHQLMIVIGIFIPMFLGLALKDPSEQDDFYIPSIFQEFWWRFMVACGLIPTLFALYLLTFVYTFDTPVYYAENRRHDDCRKLLELIHNKSDVEEELKSIVDSVREGEMSKESGMTFGAAFKFPDYRKVIIVGMVLSAFQQFGGINVFITSSSDIFKKAGLSGTMQTTMTIVMGAINVVMTFPTIFLIDKFGRKSVLAVGSLGQFIFVVPAAIMYWVQPDSYITQILAIVAVLGFVTCFAMGYGPILWVYLFEIYPIEIKDVAAGVATAVNWIAGIVMVFVAILLPNNISYSLFAGLQLLGTVIIFVWMKETKGRQLGDSPYITKKADV